MIWLVDRPLWDPLCAPSTPKVHRLCVLPECHVLEGNPLSLTAEMDRDVDDLRPSDSCRRSTGRHQAIPDRASLVATTPRVCPRSTADRWAQADSSTRHPDQGRVLAMAHLSMSLRRSRRPASRRDIGNRSKAYSAAAHSVAPSRPLKWASPATPPDSPK